MYTGWGAIFHDPYLNPWFLYETAFADLACDLNLQGGDGHSRNLKDSKAPNVGTAGVADANNLSEVLEAEDFDGDQRLPAQRYSLAGWSWVKPFDPGRRKGPKTGIVGTLRHKVCASNVLSLGAILLATSTRPR